MIQKVNNILNDKKKKGEEITKKYKLKKDRGPLGLVKIDEKILIKDLRDAFLTLPANFVLLVDWIKGEDNLGENIIAIWHVGDKELVWYDFIISTSEIKNKNNYFSAWIVPIIAKDNSLSKILKEFNPAKNEWNAFIFNKKDKWNIYYTIVRYLENYKFSFDNKNLVKNVLDI